MEDRPDMRASDADRQEVVERLRGALDEGRLKMDEYLERMGLAYEAMTYGDLVPLYRDLPEAKPAVRPQPAAPSAPVPPPQGRGRQAGRLRRPADTAQGAVDDLGHRGIYQRGDMGAGQRHLRRT